MGHSLGTRAVLLYLEKYPTKIEKVFLVAAFANDTSNAVRHDGETYPDFFEHKINLGEIRKQIGKFVVMHSKDDDSIDYSQGKEISEDLGADLATFKDRGHFINPNNAPFILEVLRRELGF